ncbi:MAG: hypothetical protein KBF98_00305 [Rhodoferax sp.]|jgi:hypothetical protein|nr:hypothetical protein [Rhodoferax sp.]MBP9684907.1 hypothetical protein [Rhodoferax sp.]
MSLQDFLYVDLPKLTSLSSQIFSAEKAASAQAPALPHPCALLALEAELSAQGYLMDLTRGAASRSLREPGLRSTLASTLCVKVTGRAVIEDYQRIRRAMENLPETVDFVNKTVQASVRNTDDFRQTEMTIAAEVEQLKENVDRYSRAASQSHILQMKADLDHAIKSATTAHGVEQWVLDGLKSWIDNHLAGIVKLRVYLSPESADEQIFGNLKRECFLEQNPDSLHFSLGADPDTSITLVGIITSVPAEEADSFDPLAEFDRESLSNLQTFEKGNREVLKNINTLERLARTVNFPRVMVQPLMVYRSFTPNPSATAA